LHGGEAATCACSHGSLAAGDTVIDGHPLGIHTVILPSLLSLSDKATVSPWGYGSLRQLAPRSELAMMSLPAGTST
jgi:hypothetical protein